MNAHNEPNVQRIICSYCVYGANYISIYEYKPDNNPTFLHTCSFYISIDDLKLDYSVNDK